MKVFRSLIRFLACKKAFKTEFEIFCVLIRISKFDSSKLFKAKLKYSRIVKMASAGPEAGPAKRKRKDVNPFYFEYISRQKQAISSEELRFSA